VGQIRPDGGTALMAARYAGHDDVAELLLSRGADGNEDDGPGTPPSPPRVSAEAHHRPELGSRRLAVGDAGRVRDMIADRRREGKDVGSLVNARAHAWTPLHEASNRGHAEAITALVEGGAVVDQVTQSDGKSPLIIASELGHTEAVKVLLAAGASVERIKQDGETAMMGACVNGHRDVVELLLDQGADVGLTKHSGWTTLMLACRNGHRGVSELLLDRGAVVGQADKDGWTALMLACQDGHRDVGELLLDRGADAGQANEDGQTALMVARHAERGDVVELLLSRGNQRSPRAADETPNNAELGRLASSRRIAVRTST